ncbi:MAG: cytochrome c biogenesis protein CcdC [Gemmatimonadota bacterium]|nr:cytochrome c biogenesis protein CcdC [Gemmatimonadota bacterium]MDH5759793.1 cytochrome c biogenesis protein CcdC [Gemmatimonadota bacterium]
MNLLPFAASVVGGTSVLVWRLRETRTPVTTAKILIPPLGMSTGFLMFAVPAMRIPWTWAGGAFLVGALVLSWPLARTSSLEHRGGVVMMRRSNGFLLILLGLLAVRLALHEYVGHLLPPKQTASMLFVLAFGMILRWRTGMYLRYRRMASRAEPAPRS